MSGKAITKYAWAGKFYTTCTYIFKLTHQLIFYFQHFLIVFSCHYDFWSTNSNRRPKRFSFLKNKYCLEGGPSQLFIDRLHANTSFYTWLLFIAFTSCLWFEIEAWCRLLNLSKNICYPGSCFICQFWYLVLRISFVFG